MSLSDTEKPFYHETGIIGGKPLDQFARGQRRALTESQKRGALLFFGRARCVECHRVAGDSNEMFSDFTQHVIGVPQVVPAVGNLPFDGPGANEDFGLEQVTGNPDDRYMFRTAPLRNAALMHPLLQTPIVLSDEEFSQLVDFVRNGLLDPQALSRHLKGRVPQKVPSGLPVLDFEFE